MPTFDDIPNLESLTAAGVVSGDFIPVYQRSTNKVKRVPASDFAASADVLTPEALIIPEFPEAYVPAANELGTKDGQLSVGDGASVQGNLVASSRRITGSAIIDVAGLPKAGAAKRVVALPLYASEVVVGATLKVSGTVEYLRKDIQAISELHEGLAWDGGSEEVFNGTVGWSNVALHPNSGTNTTISFDRSSLFGTNLIGTGSAGNVLLDPASFRIAGIQAVYADGTDAVTTNAGPAPNFNFTEESPEEVDTDLWLMFQVAATGGGNFAAASTFYVNYDLLVSVTLP